MNKLHSTIGRGAAIGMVGVMCLLAGCRGERSNNPPRQFFPDMDDQPKWDPQAESEFFEDGRTMRPAVAGTVPFGRISLVSDDPWSAQYEREREDLLKDDDAFYYGVGTDGDYLLEIPITVDEQLIREGREQFDIYCSVCHGYLGDGKGMVGQRWIAPLPSFHDPKYTDPEQDQGKDGYLFHTALNGVIDVTGTQKMPGYAHAISEREAWAIVSYIRVLQTSQAMSIDDVRSGERDQLLRMLPAASAAPAAGGDS